ncbi:MAG: polyprenyl diphosphate synthase [Anaerolineae bacterium]|nr:polyprenyl diphosphate synthase [Anaerolineae bacterium]
MSSFQSDRVDQLESVPRHVAVVMDGNGRWAQARGLPRLAGHRAGTENLRQTLRTAVEFGIEILTIYAFSTENWDRPEAEVRGLLSILEWVIDRELAELDKQGVQLRHIGQVDRLPSELVAKVRHAVEITKDNQRLILNVAFSYGGRAELVNAIQRIISDGVPADQVDEALVGDYLYTAGLPDPDLIIRTGGEMRVSNFLVWQGAYSEFYATPAFWPDFDREEMYKALKAYGCRERRFGLVPK